MKRILIIGASGLLGREICGQLPGQVELIEAALSKAPYRVDISDEASLSALLDNIGRVDGMVCVAGMARFKPWAGLDADDWAYTLANKLMGQVNLVRLGAAHLNDGGAITLTSGLLAQHPIPGSVAVSTVNAAVEAFVRAAALELGPRVRVNAVSPGWIAETLASMGLDPSPGLSAAEVARVYIAQLRHGASGSVAVASR